MDSLKSLMDKKQYDLLIKLTETSTDPTYLFYRISAFLALGKGEESLKVIEANRELLEKDLKILIPVHIEILCILQKFDDAYKEMSHYENLPYVSQSVEELLQSMPKYIREEERKCFSRKTFDETKVKEMLRSEKMEDVIIGLDLVREKDIDEYLDDLRYLMSNHPKQSIRSFSLFVLVQKRVDQVVRFKHIDKVIEINPFNCKPPFVGEPFNTLTKQISVEFNNPSLSDNAIQILSTYLMFIYPDDIEYDFEEIIEALYQVSSTYLRSEKEDLKTRCQDKNLDVDRVQELIDDINFALEQF